MPSSVIPPPRRTRLDELTAIRGLAALMVVFFHARGSWHPAFASGQGVTMIVATGWMWVHFFFVLSGFVMMEAYGRDFVAGVRGSSYGRFILARFGRIYPLHFFALLVLGVAHLTGAFAVDDPPGSFAASLALVQGFTFVPLVWNAPAWSISTEWYTYLAFPFVVPLIGRLPQWITRLAWIVIACVTMRFFIGAGDAGDGDWPPGRLLLCATEFALGCLTHRLVRNGGWPVIGGRALATVVFLAPVVLLALPQRFEHPWMHAVVAVGFSVSIGVLAAEDTLVDRLLGGRIPQFLGLISYSIYLNHEILFSFARAGADAWTGRPRTLHDLPTGLSLALFALYLATLILVSWATWRWIEEPLRQWFKRKARRAPSPAAGPSQIT